MQSQKVTLISLEGIPRESFRFGTIFRLPHLAVAMFAVSVRFSSELRVGASFIIVDQRKQLFNPVSDLPIRCVIQALPPSVTEFCTADFCGPKPLLKKKLENFHCKILLNKK